MGNTQSSQLSANQRDASSQSVRSTARSAVSNLVRAFFGSRTPIPQESDDTPSLNRASRATLIKHAFPDSHPALISFLSTKELRALAPHVQFREMLNTRYGLPPEGDLTRLKFDNLSLKTIEKHCARLTKDAAQFSEAFVREPSSLGLAALVAINSLIHSSISELRFSSPHKVDLSTLENCLETAQAELEKIVNGVPAIDYFIDVLATRDATTFTDEIKYRSLHTSELFESYFSSLSKESLPHCEIKRIARISSFISHLMEIPTFECDQTVSPRRKPLSGPAAAYGLLWSIVRAQASNPWLFSHPQVRPYFSTLAERAVREYLEEASMDPLECAKMHDDISFKRSAFVETYMCDERESLRQEVLSRGPHWGTLRVLTKGWGALSLAKETAMLVGKQAAALATATEEAQRSAEESEETRPRESFFSAHYSLDNPLRRLSSAIEILQRLFAWTGPHYEAIQESFHRNASQQAQKLWRELPLPGTDESVFARLSELGIPRSTILEYLTHVNPREAVPLTLKLLRRFETSEVSHMLCASNGDTRRLRIIAAEGSTRDRMQKPNLTAEEIMRAESLRPLVRKIRRDTFSKIRDLLSAAHIRMLTMVDRSEVSSSEQLSYCQRLVERFPKRIEGLARQIVKGQSRLSPDRLALYLTQERFLEINAGLWDLPQRIPASAVETFPIGDTKNALLSLFERGIHKPLTSPSTNDGNNLSQLRAIQQAVLTKAAPQLGLKTRDLSIILEALGRSLDVREQFYALLGDINFEHRVVIPTLHLFGQQVPSIAISIIPRSHSLSWNGDHLSRFDRSDLLIEYRTPVERRISLSPVWFAENGSLILHPLSCPQAMGEKEYSVRDMVREFFRRYLCGEVPLLVPAHSPPSAQQVILGSTYHGIPTKDLPISPSVHPKLGWPTRVAIYPDNEPRILWSRSSREHP